MEFHLLGEELLDEVLGEQHHVVLDPDELWLIIDLVITQAVIYRLTYGYEQNPCEQDQCRCDKKDYRFFVSH